jgi:hypothetical protein
LSHASSPSFLMNYPGSNRPVGPKILEKVVRALRQMPGINSADFTGLALPF